MNLKTVQTHTAQIILNFTFTNFYVYKQLKCIENKIVFHLQR